MDIQDGLIEDPRVAPTTTLELENPMPFLTQILDQLLLLCALRLPRAWPGGLPHPFPSLAFPENERFPLREPQQPYTPHIVYDAG